MKKVITISTAHSENSSKEDEKLKLTLTGGSPFYGFIYINDQLYQITEGARNFKVKRLK